MGREGEGAESASEHAELESRSTFWNCLGLTPPPPRKKTNKGRPLSSLNFGKNARGKYFLKINLMKKKLQNKKSVDFSKSWLNIWAERGGQDQS